MSEFKSQAEVWQALLDGKTLCQLNFLWKIIDGKLKYRSSFSTEWDSSYSNFAGNNGDLSIYTEPKPKKIVRSVLDEEENKWRK